ncbi:hypothetical protein [Paenibacillus polymyxa]|uniref:hypothetical protein n=1 Tax=Paenibacillus polymyxa TaxID=1406 RepID=UPI001CE29D4C|nr:hypothetical protein [Paenibacillus polymyxa]
MNDVMKISSIDRSSLASDPVSFKAGIGLADRGLGKHLALELLKRGAKVYTGAINPDSVVAATKVAKNVRSLRNNLLSKDRFSSFYLSVNNGLTYSDA